MSLVIAAAVVAAEIAVVVAIAGTVANGGIVAAVGIAVVEIITDSTVLTRCIVGGYHHLCLQSRPRRPGICMLVIDDNATGHSDKRARD
jgi:hypothetical protein